MKKYTLKELKENLSDITDLAAQGETVEISKYNKPYISLGPAKIPETRTGKSFGIGQLQSLGVRLTRGTYLALLEKDRES